MQHAEYLLPLPSGDLISYEQVFSPFVIYAVVQHPDCYILLPNREQHQLRDIIIVANNNGIRICGHRRWPRMFVTKIHQIVDCKSNDKFLKIDYSKIPTDLKYSIALDLIEKIPYQ